MPTYRVMVDDNYHYQDPKARYVQGTYRTAPEAMAVCRRIVDDWLDGTIEAGMSAEALYGRYQTFGEGPFIVVVDGSDAGCAFSAWDYEGTLSGCRAGYGD